jgi:hypothetical protein
MILTPKQVKTIERIDKELASLINALNSLDLVGHEVARNFSHKEGRYVVRDETGSTITGSWGYVEVNLFLLGYGKALRKNNS